MEGAISIVAGAALATGVVLLFWLLFSTADGLYRFGRQSRRPVSVWPSVTPGYPPQVDRTEKDLLLERIDEALDDSPKGRTLKEIVESLPVDDADDDPNPNHGSPEGHANDARSCR